MAIPMDFLIFKNHNFALFLKICVNFWRKKVISHRIFMAMLLWNTICPQYLAIFPKKNPFKFTLYEFRKKILQFCSFFKNTCKFLGKKWFPPGFLWQMLMWSTFYLPFSSALFPKYLNFFWQNIFSPKVCIATQHI